MTHRPSPVATVRAQPSRRANYAHPASHRPAPPPKRELTATQLFFFKIFACFAVPDDLPPPDLDKPIYQAAKSTSSVTRTATSTPDSSDFSRKTSLSSATATTSNTASTPTPPRVKPPKTHFPRVAAVHTPVARFSLPQAQKPNAPRPASASNHSSSSSSSSSPTCTTAAPASCAAHKQRQLEQLPQPSISVTPNLSSNISRLSAMFEQ